MSLYDKKMPSLKDKYKELSNDDLKEEAETLKGDSYFCEKCGRNHRKDSKIGKKHYE